MTDLAQPQRSLPTMSTSCRDTCKCTCLINDDKSSKEESVAVTPATDGKATLTSEADEEALPTADAKQKVEFVQTSPIRRSCMGLPQC